MTNTKRHTPNPNLHAVVVGVDFDEEGANAIRTAIAMARMSLMELHFCHAITPRPETEKSARHMRLRLQELVAFVRPHVPTSLDERIHMHLTFAHPTEALVQLATDVEAELMVVGTHGKSGVRRVVEGSVAADMLQRAPCPVLVATPPTDVDASQKVPVVYEDSSVGSPYRLSTRSLSVANDELKPTG